MEKQINLSEFKAIEKFFSIIIILNIIDMIIGAFLSKGTIGVIIFCFGFLGITITTSTLYLSIHLRKMKKQ